MAAVPSAIVVALDGPICSPAELVVRARSGNVKFGSTGIGTSSHVKLELLNRAAGVQILHASYRGSADLIAADLARWARVAKEAGIQAE
ncbi:tripartite tricarboxylate transporter substrate-binding protein [Muricoccus nepalensis]|uniref:tripartite tricarboxylate transporter substrate-binding protein n=1 Tax=Muricoccus nepalensis TaxID=1854500 RepID=UPI0038D15C8B